MIKTELLKLIPRIKDNNVVMKNSTKEKHTDGKLLLNLSKIYNYFLKSEKKKNTSLPLFHLPPLLCMSTSTCLCTSNSIMVSNCSYKCLSRWIRPKDFKIFLKNFSVHQIKKSNSLSQWITVISKLFICSTYVTV